MRAQMTDLTPLLVMRMQGSSEANAPWSNMTGDCWDFIVASLHAGVPWKVCSRALDRWLVPETSTERRRQEAARQPGVFDVQPDFSCGIGLLERHYLGGMTGKGWQGDGDSYYARTSSPIPSEFADLARVMGVFWPDIPSIVWTQVRPLLSARAREVEDEMYGATSEFAVDQVDALKLFRFLDHCNRTAPTYALVDWKAVINPPGSSEMETRPHVSDGEAPMQISSRVPMEA